MRIALRALADIQVVPPRAGVSVDVARAACIKASGEWIDSPPGCKLNIGASLPGYCSWIPFATSILDECKLPTTPDDLNAYGNYTAYETGQLQNAACRKPDGTVMPCTGAQAEAQQLAENQQQSEHLLSLQTCDYMAASDYPGISQVFGPRVAGMLTNPFSSNCQSEGGMPGWMLYVGIAVAAGIAISLLMGGRR